MPTNRPFFATFFAAFRAHTNPTFQAKSSTTSAVSPTSLTATAHISTTANASSAPSSNPRTITTKATATDPSGQNSNNANITSPTRSTTSPFSAAAAAAAASSHRYTAPLSRSPGTSSPNGPHSHNVSMSPPGTSTPLTRGRQRRGSDSSNSSGGFMDALGPEKWYIGGRTATGEEKFYRLGLVTSTSGRRVRSLDRLSL